jgi:hypothetical protein
VLEIPDARIALGAKKPPDFSRLVIVINMKLPLEVGLMFSTTCASIFLHLFDPTIFLNGHSVMLPKVTRKIADFRFLRIFLPVISPPRLFACLAPTRNAFRFRGVFPKLFLIFENFASRAFYCFNRGTHLLPR